tara:strand:+ start:8666 stop:9790 length:1125 start_codon:yes stop_codon:yes gene_type:complete
MMDIQTRLSKAKTSLMLEYPFWGTLVMNMPFSLDENIPTACTNGKWVKFNPDFVDTLNDEELKFLVAHEIAHPMFEHTTRRGERDGYKWNQAGDYVINKILTDEGLGKMPEGGLLDVDLYNRCDGVTDKIYNELPDTPEDGRGYGSAGQPFDDVQDGGQSQAEIAQQQAEWRVKVAQAVQSAKMMGKLSAGVERLVGELLTPKVLWADVMQRFVVKAKTDDRTFARPNRRFIQQGMYLPSITGEVMGELVWAVDCSGSIGQVEIDQFATEIIKVWEDHKPIKTHVIYFDSEVSHYDCFGQDDRPEIKPHGGGGTAFSPVFEYMQDNDISPVACVFLTDLCCNDFGTEPDCPVLWVTTDAEDAPFGEVVKMEGVN